jgi:exopolysaccharide production protein ExoQ
MNPSVASLIFACGIAGLFYLNRDSSLRTSKALWLPVIWIWIVGSRPVSSWLGVTPTGGNVQIDGSPLDAAVLGVLLVAAIGVLLNRSSRAGVVLLASWPVLIYFAYCLISVTWSYHPDVALKRWVKAIGDLAMVLVIATEPKLRDALYRLFYRVGFLLFPGSLLLIKYYGDLGRGYTPDGGPMNTGVTTNKNMLGVMLLVISLGTLWRLVALFRARTQPNRGRQLLAQGVLLAFGIELLGMADSATSIACFALGGSIILTTSLGRIRNKPARVHMLCLGIVIAGGLTMLIGGTSTATAALGRQSNLTGRTDIWAAVIPAAPSAIVGAGFESFWISPSVEIFRHNMVGFWHPEGLNEAHNGYIEVYLELGWVGVCVVAFILVSGYKRAVAAFRRNPSIGSLMLGYTIVSAVYSVTEAGFRMLDPIWIFLLLAVVTARGIAAGYIGDEAPRILSSRARPANRAPSNDQHIPEREIAYAAWRTSAQFRIAVAQTISANASG